MTTKIENRGIGSSVKVGGQIFKSQKSKGVGGTQGSYSADNSIKNF